jgi:hypothetical protein
LRSSESGAAELAVMQASGLRYKHAKPEPDGATPTSEHAFGLQSVAPLNPLNPVLQNATSM